MSIIAANHPELNWDRQIILEDKEFDIFIQKRYKKIKFVAADAHNLPFRDNYADIIVSRGSYHFWEDKVRAFSEIYRVLKPGAVAYIGRGFSRNMPVETAKKIRAKQGKKMKYDVDKKANELYNIMNELGIKDYRIDIPKPPGSENVNYGIWIEFRKTG